jgi:hypothetical protein
VGVYELHKPKLGNKAAIELARDQMGRVLLGGIRSAPATTRFYDAVANAMVVFSKINEPTITDIIKQVFTKRKILQPRIKMLASFPKPPQAGYIEGTNKRLARTASIKTVVLGRVLGITAQSDNPLMSVEIEIPTDVGYELNADGRVIDEKRVSIDETINGARMCLNYLYQKQALGQMFDVVNNKLIRTKFIN